MSDRDQETEKLANLLKARVLNGLPPIVLHAAEADLEHVRAALQRMGVPDNAFDLRATPTAPQPPTMTPQERVRLAMALAEFQRTDPYRMARACHVAADAMLDRYRHNDPEAAARIRAERKGRRA